MLAGIFEFYSYGLVVRDKLRDVDTIYVSPIDVIPDWVSDPTKKDINLGTDVKSVNTLIPDASGVDKHVVANETGYITAGWLPIGEPNRLTAPDVVTDDLVLIYTNRLSNEYMWCMGTNDFNLRKLEHIVIGISNEPKRRGLGIDLNNLVLIKLSTVEKILSITTPDNDGEYCKYNVSIDMLKGELDFSDDKGNYSRIKSHIDTIDTYAMKEVLCGSGREIIITTPKVTIQASEYLNISDTSITFQSPTITLDGNVTVTKGLTVAGTLSGTTINGTTINGGIIDGTSTTFAPFTHVH